MNFTNMKKDIQSIIKEAKGNASLSIKTPEGEININDTQVKSAASVIKVPMAMACLELADKGDIDLTMEVPINPTVAGTGVLHYLYGCSKISLKNALALSIIVSDNTAANIVIDAVGIERAQHFFTKVGAKQTSIGRKFMDHVSLEKGIDNVTTAGDMRLFMECFADSSTILSAESKALLKKIMQDQQLKDKLPAYQNMFMEDVTIGNKTGTLAGVEHDVGYFEKDGQATYIAVMSSDLEYNRDGQQMIAEIGKKVLDYMS